MTKIKASKDFAKDFKNIITTSLTNISGEKLVENYIRNTIQENSGANDEYSNREQQAAKDAPYASYIPQAIVAIGKAAVSMTRGAIMAINSNSQHFTGNALVVTKYNHNDNSLDEICPNLQIIESAHPVPDENSLRAGEAIVKMGTAINQRQKELQKEWRKEDEARSSSQSKDRPKVKSKIESSAINTTSSPFILVLISGGTSALAEVLKEGWGLEQLQQLNKEMLSTGADISQINQKRKEISLLKDGGLARLMLDTNILALYLSDVPTNDVAVIGSGILATPNDTITRVTRITHKILADNATARQEVATAASELGYSVVNHDFLITGDVEETSQRIYELMNDNRGAINIFGGEPVVTLPPQPGIGGRNQHLALLMARIIAGDEESIFASVGTDGSDGFTHYAGALVTNKTMKDITNCGMSGEQAIRKANSTQVLEEVHATIETGPTGTNLMDIMIGYISQ